jgi:DNA invertase Pin-like site-specific DNA recombinase
MSELEIIKPENGGESAVKLSINERPTIQKMYSIIDNPDNKIEAVYVWELSRLSRRLTDLFLLKEHFDKKGINLISTEFGLRRLDKSGKKIDSFNLLFAIQGVFAENEIELKNERIKRGKKEKSEKGFMLGKNAHFGYKVAKDKKIEIDDNQAETVRLIFNLYASGKYGYLSLQKELESRNIFFNFDRLAEILSYRLYTGERVQKVFNRQLPQIISSELFNKCRQIAKSRDAKSTKTNRIYYAGRLIKCSSCNSYLVANPYASTIQYVCKHSNNENTKRECTGNDRISVNVMDSIAWYYARLKETEYINELTETKIADWNSQIVELQSKIDSAENQYKAVKTKKRNTLKKAIKSLNDVEIEKLVIDETKDDYKRIQNEVINYKETITHLNSYIEQSKKVVDAKEMYNNMKEIFDNLEKLTDRERREIVHKHIKEIHISTLAAAQTPTIQINIEYYDGNTDTIYYAYRQNKKKDLRLYYYSPLFLNRKILPDDVDSKIYIEWDRIYIERFVPGRKKKQIGNLVQ